MISASTLQKQNYNIAKIFFVGCLCLSGRAFTAETIADKIICESLTAQHCLDIQHQKQTMHDDIDLQNKELSQQITTMNLAPKDQKMELMAGVITNLVRQQTVMDARRTQMEDKMMAHLMAHLSPSAKELIHCQMMSGKGEIKSAPVKSGATHNEPREEK